MDWAEKIVRDGLVGAPKNVSEKFSRRNEILWLFSKIVKVSHTITCPAGTAKLINNTKINLKGQLLKMLILPFRPIQEDDLG
jgi:hypothetical protein